MSELLKLDGLSVGYGPIHVIKSLSMQLHHGELVAVLGANGAGKSTLLRTISGVLHPSAGRVLWRGQPIQGWPAHKIARLGIVHAPEGRAIFPDLTVAENLQLGGFARSQEQRPAISLEDVFRVFPALRERLSQRAGTLSGGQQQMLAIGRGLLAQPLLLILDEPLLGLAPALAQQVLKALREIVTLGVTVFLVEQDAGAAIGVADRVYVLAGGQIVAEGTDDIHHAYFGNGAGASAEGQRETVSAQHRDNDEGATPVLTVEDVSIRFGGNVALDRVSLEVSDGEIVGLIGPNGAGKSTLINCISRFVVPNTGRIRVFGQDTKRVAPHKLSKLGLTRTFQNLQLFGTMTVFENVLAAVEVSASRGSARAADVRRLLEQFDLGQYALSRTASLPYGIRKLVELARAVGTRPKVLLLDEPAAGLNTDEKEQFTRILRRILQTQRMSILLVEHDMPTVEALADRVYVLDAGRCIAQGNFSEIAHDPEVIRAYLGDAWSREPTPRTPSGASRVDTPDQVEEMRAASVFE